MYNENSTSDSYDVEHCSIPLPKNTELPSHPFNNKLNHEKLLKYLRGRLLAGKQGRDNEIKRFVQIDKNVAGWRKLSDADKARERKKDKDGTPQAVTMNLPLAYVHIDDMMTYFAQTFAPNRGMFYQLGKPDEVDQASQIVTLMNNHAIYSGYYRQVLLGIFSILKYNRGGYNVFWSQEQGPKISKDSRTGNDKVDMQLRWQGNRLEAIDMYNFMPDPMVHPTELHSAGEFAATARMRSYYWMQNKASQGIYFNCEDALKNYKGIAECNYYRSPPEEAQFNMDESTGQTNWVSVLAEVPGGYTKQAGFELVEISIRINPTEFGLVPKNSTDRSRYEIWQFTILNDKWIVATTYLNNIHGFLPFFMGLLNDDLMSTSQKSVAEILQPLQDFASHLLNIHVMSTRSSVWGLTVYDPTVVNLAAIENGEVNARIPVLPAGYGKNLNESIWTKQSNLDTKQTLGDLSSVMDIINQFFPTQSLPSQIASIDRAVTDQVAAVQQGANRRQQKAARLLDDSMFRNVRFAMYYNIIQYQPDESEVTDFYTGKPMQIDLNAIRNTDLPFIIGQGLKSLDRASAAQSLQQIIFALIQAPQAAQGIDILGLIDYWTGMLDIDIDMKQFAIQPPVQPGAAGDAEGGDTAAAATGGAPITPATNPQRLTAPIYGGQR